MFEKNRVIAFTEQELDISFEASCNSFRKVSINKPKLRNWPWSASKINSRAVFTYFHSRRLKKIGRLVNKPCTETGALTHFRLNYVMLVLLSDLNSSYLDN